MAATRASSNGLSVWQVDVNGKWTDDGAGAAEDTEEHTGGPEKVPRDEPLLEPHLVT